MWGLEVIFCLAVVLAGAAGQRPMSKCEDIAVPICADLGYNTTVLPNVLGHKSQAEATAELKKYDALLNSNCSQHVRLFVCSIFVPFCSIDMPEAVRACRGLCEIVHSDCKSILEALPPLPDCKDSPEPPKVCMQLPTELQKTGSKPTTSTKATQRKSRNRRCPSRFSSLGDSCIPLCGQDACYRKEDKDFVHVWTSSWSWLCFAYTSFTLLTFCVQASRFHYPERPVLFIALCCMLMATLHLMRDLFGVEAFTCSGDRLSHSPWDNLVCTFSAAAMLYLGLAASGWWAVLCFSWYLNAAREWSSEALEKNSRWFHAMVWLGAVIPAMVAVFGDHIEANELTGMCSVKDEVSSWLVAGPRIALLTLGALLALKTAQALVKVRGAIRFVGRDSAKLERLMCRLAVFAVLYMVPESGAIACILYESSYRPRWKSLALLSALDCQSQQACKPEPSYHTAALEVVLLRVFLTLVVGVTASMWVWSGKTWRIWRNFFYGPQTTKSVPIVRV